MAQRKALGRGLLALIPEVPTVSEGGVLEVPIAKIVANPLQPRKRFDQKKLQELSASIKTHGILSPVILRQADEGYELVAGERRLRAAKMAGLLAVPAVIREVSQAESLEVALIENIQREDLNPVEEAEVYQRLLTEFGLHQEELASRVGRDRSSVANSLRLLRLPKKIREDLAVGALSEGHARALLGLEKAAEQLQARDRILKRHLSVRETEALVRRLKGRRSSRGLLQGRGDPHIVALQDKLRQRFTTKVQVLRRGRGGVVEIYFYSFEDLERVADLLLGDGRR